MKNNIVYRVAEKEDLPAILDLYAQPNIDDGATLSYEKAEDIFTRFSKYPYYKIFVAQLSDRIVGTFALLIMDNLGHLGAPSAIIEDVAVNPEFQNKGIGKLMMHHGFEIAKQNGCYKVMLSANLKRDAAHKFYGSIGFERHGYSYLFDITHD